MIAESTISSNHQWSSCYDVPTIDHHSATYAALPLWLEHRLHLMCSATPSPAHVRTWQDCCCFWWLAFKDCFCFWWLAFKLWRRETLTWPPSPKSQMTVYWLPCLSLPTFTVPLAGQLVSWPGAQRALWNMRVWSTYEILNEILIANMGTTHDTMSILHVHTTESTSVGKKLVKKALSGGCTWESGNETIYQLQVIRRGLSADCIPAQKIAGIPD